MAVDIIQKFLNALPLDRFEMALDDASAEGLQAYLGRQAFEELRSLAAETVKAKKSHLGLNIPPNLIFVPGVMGSLLLSSKQGGIWWVDVRTRDFINKLRLSPDGQHDADLNSAIIPVTADISYQPFFAAVLKREDLNHEIFAYDWRKPLTASAGLLRGKINEAYANNGNESVHLVAHSMGGLMVRAALMLHGDELWPKLGRIVFLGTPHYGSQSIGGYLKNHLWGFDLMALLGQYLDRETFRSLWGVISMLPAPRGIYPGTRERDLSPWAGADAEDEYVHPCSNFDMYEANKWELGLTDERTTRLNTVLEGAAKFHRDLYGAHQRLSKDQLDRMAVVVGVGYKTLFRLAYQKHFWGLWEKMDKTVSRVPDDIHRDGDGRVPVASAVLENVGEVRFVKGVHGELPMIPDVYEDVFRWLSKKPMKLPDSPTAALQSHLGGASPGRSETPALTLPTSVDEAQGDPGFWDFNPPPQEHLTTLQAQLEVEALPAFNKIRLL